jgi:hypothetical protein
LVIGIQLCKNDDSKSKNGGRPKWYRDGHDNTYNFSVGGSNTRNLDKNEGK